MLQNVKVLHKRTVAQLTLIILLVSGVILPTPIPSAVPVTEAQTVNCSVPTLHTFSNRVWHNWIANGQPLSSYCWSVTPMRVAVVGNTCGWTEKAFEFYYGGSVSQTFFIPVDAHNSSFQIRYTLDFIDPNDHPTWNVFEMKVVDTNTGTTLASEYFNGSMGDLDCSTRSFTWNQDLAGHTIQVRFKGSRGYSNTFIRVRDIVLLQNTV
jgi:hypothetical protein